MLTLDKVAIINSFIRVVQIIKSVRTETLVEIDKLKHKVDNQALGVIDDEAAGPEATWSAAKIKNYVAEQVAAILGGADEDSDTLKEIADQLKASAAKTTDLVSVTGPQEFTAEQKAQVLANLGINKEFLIGLLVNDEETDAQTLWSSRKVDTQIKEAKLVFDADEVVTDDELESILANIATVPAPTKAGQVLVTIQTDNGLVLQWQDAPAPAETSSTTEEPTNPEAPADGTEGTPAEETPDVVDDEDPDVTVTDPAPAIPEDNFVGEGSTFASIPGVEEVPTPSEIEDIDFISIFEETLNN